MCWVIYSVSSWNIYMGIFTKLGWGPAPASHFCHRWEFDPLEMPAAIFARGNTKSPAMAWAPKKLIPLVAIARLAARGYHILLIGLIIHYYFHCYSEMAPLYPKRITLDKDSTTKMECTNIMESCSSSLSLSPSPPPQLRLWRRAAATIVVREQQMT